MQVVRAFFDGHNIKPIDPIKTKKDRGSCNLSK